MGGDFFFFLNVTFGLTRLFWRVRPSGRGSQAAAAPVICTAGSSRAPPVPQAENRCCTVGQRARAAAVAAERDDDGEEEAEEGGGGGDELAEEGDAAEPGPEFRPVVEDAARMVALGWCSSVEEEVDADAAAADADGADADLSGAGFLQSGPAPSSRDRRFSASVSV